MARKKKKQSKPAKRKRFNVKPVVLNCSPSEDTEDDWTFEDAIAAGAVEVADEAPGSKDLRASWWKIDNQGSTGACVGFATAYGVLRWHYVEAGWLEKSESPSARFIWMANKETDGITSYPTTFIESAGTQTKLAPKITRKYGCVPCAERSKELVHVV